MRKNLIALYGVQVATLVLPLLTIPFLARVLGPSALGELAAIQSLFATLSFLIEYGFSFSATRQVAIHRDDRVKLTTIFSSVIGAKLLLTLGFVLISVSIYLLVPMFRAHPVLFWLGFLGGLAQGFNLMWFFQGIEKLSLAAMVEIVFKTFYAALVILLVRSPDDVAVVIGLQALASVLSVAVNAFNARNFIYPFNIRLKDSLNAIKEGSSMFMFRGLTLFYTTANSALLRIFVPPSTVAYYSNAERLTNISFSAFGPLNQVFFPRLSYLIHHDILEAKSLFRRCFIIILSISLISTAAGYLLSPWVVKIIFGDAYAHTADIFKIMIFTVPLISMSGLFGLQWMVPNGMNRQFNLSIALSAAASIMSVIFVVPRYKEVGMAWSVVACETIIMLSILYNTLRHRSNPFK